MSDATDVEVELLVTGRFGKRDGAGDYEWLRGGPPPGLSGVAEELARGVGSCVAVSVVASCGSELWLVRAYRHGVDDAARPVAAAEVARVLGPAGLGRERWFGLAVVSLSLAERERVVGADGFTMRVPAPQGAATAPDERLRIASRLGLPVSASPRDALALLGPGPWRYEGVAYALGEAAGWSRAFAPYLCVNFEGVRLDDGEREAVEAAMAEMPTAAEWAALDRVPASRACDALRWSRVARPPAPVTGADDGLVPWLLEFRLARSADAAAALVALRSDLEPNQLSDAVLDRLTRGLAPEAAGFLRGALRGEELTVEPGVAEGLAEGGYLEAAEVPLRLWASLGATSRVVGEAAVRQLEREGATREAARFALGLDCHPGEACGGIVKAVSLALGAGLAPPRSNVARYLAEIDPEELRALGSLCGGSVRAIAELAIEGAVPGPGQLEADEVETVLSALSAPIHPSSLECRLEALVRAGAGGVYAQRDEAAERVLRWGLRELDERSRGLVVQVLTGVGPMPAVDGVPVVVLAALVPLSDATEMASALLASYDTAPAVRSEVVEALVARAVATSAAPPRRGATAVQRRRHAALAHALSAVPGWESLSLAKGIRVERAGEFLRSLDLTAADLASVATAETGRRAQSSAEKEMA